MPTTAPTYRDEAEIRQLYQRLLDSWGDATAYAECFTQDADYVIANGKIQSGWREIVEGHEIVFSAWGRNSSLAGRVHRLRFLTPDVALLIAYGHVVHDDHRSSDANKRTVYTLTAQRVDGQWRFVAYQNTPLGGH